MSDLAIPLAILGALLGLSCFVWLNIRMIKDGSAPDILLFLTGVSLLAYVMTRWDRAKWPFLATLGGFALAILTAQLR
jgi:hypothetical protein